MATHIKQKTTFQNDWYRKYKVELSPIEDSILENLYPNFHHKTKIDMNIWWYYFELTEEEYKQQRQLQREQIHQDTLDRVYWRKEYNAVDILLEDYYEEKEERNGEIDIDDLNDDLAIENHINA